MQVAFRFFLLFLFSFQFIQGASADSEFLRLKAPAAEGRNIVFRYTGETSCDSIRLSFGDFLRTYYQVESGQEIETTAYNGSGKQLTATAYSDGSEQTQQTPLRSMPGWLSILPPLLAIIFAIAFKEVISSLFLGILSGVFIHLHYVFPGKWVLSGIFLSITDYLLPAVADSGHISVILFSLLIGGTVAVISKNAGMAGMVRHISKFAKTPRSAQMATWFLGILIFFDDYANTLVVGNTMRPVTDKLRISREKLAYIVDATAAPVASIAFVTTWIGAQLGYIQDGIDTIDGLNSSPYAVFISSLQYAFYPIFTLFFMWLLIRSKKDFGPMLYAEQKARNAADLNDDVAESEEITSLDPDPDAPKRAFNAVIPVLVLIFGTLTGLWVTGYSDAVWNDAEHGFWSRVSRVIGNADSYKALLWSSVAALSVSIILSVSQRILKLQDSLNTVLKGFGFMLNAVVILCLAWTLSSLTEYLETATYITSSLQAINANPLWFPAITFVLAALVSFSTGSSWSTMAILYPMLLPAVWLLCMEQGMEPDAVLRIFFNVVSCVLAGSVLGDHCSPISDTTILSSLATSCNHLAHVRTQMPYALTVGAISVFVGTIPASMGAPTWLLYPLGFLGIYVIIRIFGRLTD